MLKLLVVADDFTGALDSGVQFASLGAAVKVVTHPQYDLTQTEGLDVLIFDAESRHKDSQTAYRIVHDFVKRVSDFGVEFVYKKTDSGLRGNIGAELAGAMDALGREEMAFVPAFPAMSRVTRDGVHYINGIPVAQSMFGSDPFEPVKSSYVHEIISSQTDKKGIYVYDAETDGDMVAIAGHLGHEGLRLTAGCAGFAGVLAHVLGYHGSPREVKGMPEKFVMLCGSVNPVTRAQMDYAGRFGFVYRALSPEQKLSPTWPGSPECSEAARRWLGEFGESHAILDANNPDETEATNEYIRTHSLTVEEVRLNISRAIAGAGKALMDEGLDARLMCVGGDTLLALMEAVGVHELVPLCEEELGVVLTSFSYGGKSYYIMTKSGGFGEPDLLVKLASK
ncbi:MAG: four-carbon acid sugar kinase family protein [Synergistaceae bacterium]|nr:four-carbon acid sugar kinase family protein [Synergistaceae bacterium]